MVLPSHNLHLRHKTAEPLRRLPLFIVPAAGQYRSIFALDCLFLLCRIIIPQPEEVC